MNIKKDFFKGFLDIVLKLGLIASIFLVIVCGFMTLKPYMDYFSAYLLSASKNATFSQSFPSLLYFFLFLFEIGLFMAIIKIYFYIHDYLFE